MLEGRERGRAVCRIACLKRFHYARLEPGTTYDWYVALVLDPKARDADVVAGGAIQRRAATPELTADGCLYLPWWF